MKIRCGSHQQNRSIVRPGLSLMATKVALTAEEFRENSQRSIDLFNTEKLSTDSTRVLKSVYCNSVHFCRCNLRGACGGKACRASQPCCGSWLQSARSVWRQRRHYLINRKEDEVAICAERVEAKRIQESGRMQASWLQSARSVWRQSERASRPSPCPCALQSARSVWRQRGTCGSFSPLVLVAICAERVEAKLFISGDRMATIRCNLRGACGGKGVSVWDKQAETCVAICAERVEAKRFLAVQYLRAQSCNLRGACGGKGTSIYQENAPVAVAICAERVEAKFVPPS